MEAARNGPRNFHSCDLCCYGSKSLLIMFNHIRKHHSRRKVYLFSCDFSSAEAYQCERCGFETDLLVNLTDHVNVVHKQTDIKYDMRHILMRYGCDRCDFQTHSLLVLAKHACSCARRVLKRAAKKAEWFKCEQCSYRIKHKNNLKRHVVTKHGNPEDIKWFKCESCSYKAKRKCHLEKHVLCKHTNPEDVQWLECEQCGLKTKHKNTLKSHILAKHSKPKDIRWFSCVQCPFKTKYKYNLKEHIIGRHRFSNKDREFKCEGS